VPIITPTGYAAVAGMQRAAAGIERGADDVLATTRAPVDGNPAVVNEVRSLDEIGRATPPRDLEDSMLDIKRHHYGYRANVQTARVEDARFEQLIDMVTMVSDDSRVEDDESR
jgi:hypothetical protein